MPSLNLLYSTFLIGIEENSNVSKLRTGTMFVVNVDNKQYIITASHLFDGIAFPGQIKIFLPIGWNNLSVELIGMGNSEILGHDIAVLTTNKKLIPSEFNLKLYPAVITAIPVYFLGFPLGYHTFTNFKNTNIPIIHPLVKSGIFSGLIDPPDSDVSALLIDGHNNQGFSGGPVVIQTKELVDIAKKDAVDMSGQVDIDDLISTDPKNTHFTVIGVVNSFLDEYIQNKFNNENTVSNSGIMVCSPINFAQMLIEKNPTGLDLK